MRKERQNVSRLNSANLHALHAAVLTAEDSNSGFRRFQKRSEIFDNRLVRTIFHGRSLNSQLQRSLNDADNFVAARTRLYAHRKHNTAVFGNDVELLSGAGRDATCGIYRGGQPITRRADTARAARSWYAILARLAGANSKAVREGVLSFAGVEHRLEFVAEIKGVRYYNDSKATNVDATLKALDAFPGRIIVILGGKDKGSDYTPLQVPLRERAILALLIGAAADKIASQIDGSVAIERAGTLDHAVEMASQAANVGDVVLLAPACASFDQFQNYEHRGQVFKALVRELQQRADQLPSTNRGATSARR